ncbi:hypothetical protein PVAP13_6KG140206 [Panicum virgatum]|uniref:Uncharacterized protein n=1 Tax=Panicum virgatum TaxID=38727 RepID=A0A8T0RDY8_PANVG|nr:hypothetical protein PVAP13_6KG140206 [Panicum virgatum]
MPPRVHKLRRALMEVHRRPCPSQPPIKPAAAATRNPRAGVSFSLAAARSRARREGEPREEKGRRRRRGSGSAAGEAPPAVQRRGSTGKRKPPRRRMPPPPWSFTTPAPRSTALTSLRCLHCSTSPWPRLATASPLSPPDNQVLTWRS